jgi:hypothetical protein
MADSIPHTTQSEDNMITDFLKSMFPVDLNPPSGVPYIGCGVWGVGCWVLGVGCGVWGVGCWVWGVGCRV